MLELEMSLNESGYEYIACIDEVGRGCLAGDVVACAIVMPKGLRIDGVKDSKKLSEKKRNELYSKILEEAIACGIGQVSPDIIDKINIKEATRLAMKFAVENLIDKNGNKFVADYLLIDAETVNIDMPQNAVIKGDDKSHGIACSSIVAKVYRDSLCSLWDEEFPGYNMKKHKGYGTKEHREYILDKGPSEMHRISFLGKILNR